MYVHFFDHLSLNNFIFCYFHRFSIFFSHFAGITKWETIISSFNLSSNGKVCSANTDRLESVPLSHLPLQDIFSS